MFLPRQRQRRAPGETALRYAAEYRWDVVAGAHRVWDGHGVSCSCGQATCARPGGHATSDWLPSATTDEATIRHWWSWRPNASIVIPTGRGFDVLDVPAAAGTMALRQLEHMNVSLGPVAATTSRLWFFVAPGACEELPALLEWLDWTGIDLDLHAHGDNRYIIAPTAWLASERPSAEIFSCWVRLPFAANHQLPHAVELLNTLATACHQSAVTAALHSGRALMTL